MALELSRYTNARVALGQRVSTRDVLQFALDHARARDAVHAELDPASLGFPHTVLTTQAKDRKTFLLRPDLGRRLNEKLPAAPCDAVIVLADGLSALAIHRQAKRLLDELLPKLADWHLAPIYVVRQARVAIGDEIGSQLSAKLSLVLIGERPGLQSPDSLGAYLTWNPRPGRNDAERNCVSNIRPEGLSYPAAATLIHFLMSEARNRQLSGVTLKDDAPSQPVLSAGPDS